MTQRHQRLGKPASRTKNSIFNFITGMGGELVGIILQFVVRTVFIHTLGKQYLGIGSVFSNILSMLSLAELGVGSAILYKLYQPIAEEDQQRITVLMHFYRRVYRWIGLVIGCIGLLMIPVLPYLVKDYGKLAALQINPVFIFLLYLFRTISSYLFFAYKRAIIKANQQEYIVNLVKLGGTIISSIVQIILLSTARDFTLYVGVLILTTIGENIAIAIIANIRYPFINEKDSERLSKEEIKGVVKDCYALMIYKMNGVVLKATDNLVLSSFLGLDYVALYSNYYIFYTHMGTIMNRVYGSVVHSLGNLHVTNKGHKEYDVFILMNFITAVIGATACIGLFCVADELIDVWVGSGWVLQQPFSALMGLEIYTLAVRHELSRFRNSMGLFQQAKYRPVAGMVINLVVSVILVRYWGICGVLVGTIAADWLTIVWYDPIIIHKYGFKKPEYIRGYFVRYAAYTLLLVLSGAICYLICTHVLSGLGWLSVVAHTVFCALLVPLIYILAVWNKPTGKFARAMLMKILRKKRQTA